MTTILRIYANWCFHCINMLPEWNKTKSKLKNKKINVIDIEQQEMYKLFKFNSDNKLNITPSGFPTIVKVKNGKVSYYNGERTSEKMLKWILSNNKTKKNKTNNKRKKGKNKTKRKLK